MSVTESWSTASGASAAKSRDSVEATTTTASWSAPLPGIGTAMWGTSPGHDRITRPFAATRNSGVDRLAHNAYSLNLRGESMRKTPCPLNQNDHFTQQWDTRFAPTGDRLAVVERVIGITGMRTPAPSMSTAQRPGRHRCPG